MHSKSAWAWKGLTGVTFVGMMLFAAGAGGCSSDDSSSGPPGVSDAASKLADGFCSAMRSCCDAAKFTYDQGSCMASAQKTYQAVIDEYKRSDKVVYDGNAVSACADALKNRQAMCVADAGNLGSPDSGYVDPVQAACWGVLKGTTPPGSPCENAIECASPGPSTDVKCKYIEDPQHPDPAQKTSCVQETAHLPIGAKCDIQDTYAKRFLYARCETTIGYCAPVANAKDGYGECKPWVEVGGTCDPTGITNACRPSLLCSPTSLLCREYPGVDEQCVQVQGPMGPELACAEGLVCDQGTPDKPKNPPTCATLKADGEECMSHGECEHGYCELKIGDDGGQTAVCSAAYYSAGQFDITRATCGFGPGATGDPDAGIAAHAQSRPVSGNGLGGRRWYDLQ